MERNRLCPWCGASSPRYCEVDEDMGLCPWEETDWDDDGQPEEAGREALRSLQPEAKR